MKPRLRDALLQSPGRSIILTAAYEWRMQRIAGTELAAYGCSNRLVADPPREPDIGNIKDETVSQPPADTVVIIDTSAGTMTARLWADQAPATVTNFLDYVDEGFYDGLIFHRVIKGFMIQGGGFTADMQQKPNREPIINEAAADQANQRGTLAMARTSEINSATSQFFINLVDNNFLNHTGETPDRFGYCAFGELIEGLDVMDKIAKVKTGSHGGYDDVPAQPVVINSIRRSG